MGPGTCTRPLALVEQDACPACWPNAPSDCDTGAPIYGGDSTHPVAGPLYGNESLSPDASFLFASACPLPLVPFRILMGPLSASSLANPCTELLLMRRPFARRSQH